MDRPVEVSADLRWARAVVVALVATTLGAVAHVSAGGLLPGAGVLVAVAAVLVVLSAAALGHPASYVAIAVLVGGGQLLVHLVLTAASGHGGPHGASPVVTPPVPLTTPRSGGVRDALTAATGAPSPSSSAPAPVSLHWLDHLRDDITGANLLMSAVHLAAAAAVAWWLFVGERSLWALVALLGTHVLRRPLRHWWLVPGPAARRPSTPSTTTLLPTRSRSQQVAADGPTGRRGPPRGAALLELVPTT